MLGINPADASTIDVVVYKYPDAISTGISTKAEYLRIKLRETVQAVFHFWPVKFSAYLTILNGTSEFH